MDILHAEAVLQYPDQWAGLIIPEYIKGFVNWDKEDIHVNRFNYIASKINLTLRDDHRIPYRRTPSMKIISHYFDDMDDKVDFNDLRERFYVLALDYTDMIFRRDSAIEERKIKLYRTYGKTRISSLYGWRQHVSGVVL